MFFITLIGLFLLNRNKLFSSPLLMKIYCASVLAPVLANQAGWVATETGRQPWIVYGLMRTPDGLSKAVKADQVLTSIIMFAFISLLLFLVWIFVIHNKIKHGPEDVTLTQNDKGMLHGS